MRCPGYQMLNNSTQKSPLSTAVMRIRWQEPGGRQRAVGRGEGVPAPLHLLPVCMHDSSQMQSSSYAQHETRVHQ